MPSLAPHPSCQLTPHRPADLTGASLRLCTSRCLLAVGRPAEAVECLKVALAAAAESADTVILSDASGLSSSQEPRLAYEVRSPASSSLDIDFASGSYIGSPENLLMEIIAVLAGEKAILPIHPSFIITLLLQWSNHLCDQSTLLQGLI